MCSSILGSGQPSGPTYRQSQAELKEQQRRSEELREQQYEQRAGMRKPRGRRSLLTGQAERGYAGTPVMSQSTLGV